MPPVTPVIRGVWRNSFDIKNEIDAIVTQFGAYASRVNVGQTSLGKTIYGLRINSGTTTGKVKALIIAGLHAREMAPPEALLSYARLLLEAYTSTQPITYPRLTLTTVTEDKENDPGHTGAVTLNGTSIPYSTILKIIKNLDLFIVPCVNLDGRNYCLVKEPNAAQREFRQNWRTNRNVPLTPCSPQPTYTFGVDLNRNFPTASWYNLKYYDNGAPTQTLATDSTNPNPCQLTTKSNFLLALYNNTADAQKVIYSEGRQTYKGPTAGSETETSTITQFINQYQFNFFMDIHSCAGQILWPWGCHHNQTATLSESFLNTSYDHNTMTNTGGRVFDSDYSGSTYHEYVPPFLSMSHRMAANFMSDCIKEAIGTDVHAVKRSAYKPQQSLELYPVLGCVDDYMMEKNFKLSSGQPAIDTSNYPVHALTLECGHDVDGGFRPKLSLPGQPYEFGKVERETHFAINSYLAYAAVWKSIYKP